MSSPRRRLQHVNQHVQQMTGQRDESPSVRCDVRAYKTGHHVATITLGDPERLNLMSGQLFDELTRHCRMLSMDNNLRVVILTGSSLASGSGKPAFVGGAEMQELSTLSTGEEAGAYVTKIHDACAAVRGLPVPVIARVHGLAIGAGVQLMASCDLRIASSTSKFSMPEAKVGLPSAIQTALLPGLIGSGSRVGLVERVVLDEAQLDSAVDEWVKRMVDMPPENLRRQKKLVTLWEQSTVQEGILAGVDAMRETFADGGKETKTYMGKFLHKARK